jgi:hypothetical protein
MNPKHEKAPVPRRLRHVGGRLLRVRGGDGTEDDRPLIEQLRDKRSTLSTRRPRSSSSARRSAPSSRRAATCPTRTAPRSPTRSAFNEDFKKREREIQALDQRIDEQELEKRPRAGRRRRAPRRARPSRSEPLTYRRDLEGKVSYFGDLAASRCPASRRGWRTRRRARAPRAHAKEMNVELPKRAEARERRAQRQVDEAEREFRGSFVPGRASSAAASTSRRSRSASTRTAPTARAATSCRRCG